MTIQQYIDKRKEGFRKKFIQNADKTFTDKEGFYWHTENFESFISETEQVLLRMVTEIVGKKSEHEYNQKHMPDELYCCIQCHDDEIINSERHRILAALPTTTK